MDDAPIILDFLCYNTPVNLAELLKKSLDSTQLILIRRVAEAAAELRFPAFMVGGSVRDLLLGRPVKDIDFTVEGDAIRLGRALAKKHGGKLTVHESFGTATWTFDGTLSGLQSPDLITARKETYSSPGALPTVTRSTIDDDLRRRDFTINAMAVRLDGDHFGELYDPLGGQKDLGSKTVHVMHDRSFMDDPTRIFRAIRYAVRYGFEMEPKTLALINADSLAVLKTLSGERLRNELDLTFVEKDYPAVFARLSEFGVLSAVDAPAFNQSFARLVEDIPNTSLGISCDRIMLGYLLWLTDSDRTLIARLSNSLAFTAALTDTLLSASALRRQLAEVRYIKPSEWTFDLEKHPLPSIYGVYLLAGKEELLSFLSTWRHVKPVTTGDDLKQRGLEPGPRFGKIIRRLRAAWLDGEAKTGKDEELLLDELLK